MRPKDAQINSESEGRAQNPHKRVGFYKFSFFAKITVPFSFKGKDVYLRGNITTSRTRLLKLEHPLKSFHYCGLHAVRTEKFCRIDVLTYSNFSVKFTVFFLFCQLITLHDVLFLTQSSGLFAKGFQTCFRRIIIVVFQTIFVLVFISRILQLISVEKRFYSWRFDLKKCSQINLRQSDLLYYIGTSFLLFVPLNQTFFFNFSLCR